MSTDLPRLYSLAEAADLLAPGGKLTARSLRTEIKAGRLRVVTIAGKHFVTQQAINDMLTAATTTVSPPCLADNNQPASTGAEPEVTVGGTGSFSADRRRLARAQAL